ncbi:MAG: hypothetical protein K8T26_14160 [Lentisphaerae bacterium]|nr:hypothetical protein [Lentisphaerota bacterium]
MLRLLTAAVAVSAALALAEVGLKWLRPAFTPAVFRRPQFVATDGRIFETDKLLVDVDYAHKQRFAVDKPRGTIRIALVGGSTVEELGDAPPLSRALVEAGIARKVEILNFGLCGCGSEREVLATAQALEMGADVVVFYTGHNEFVSEANALTYRTPNWLWRHSEVLQLCFGPAWVGEPGRFYSREEKEGVYARFHENLQTAVSLCRGRGVVAVVGVPPTNLLEPPLIYTCGMYDVGSLPPEPYHHYHRGMELVRHGKIGEGMDALEEAVDESPRPWRATRRIKRILRDLAAENSLPLADVDGRLRAKDPSGFPNPGVFVDHCHLNGYGKMLLLETFFKAIVEARGPASGGT